MTLDIQQTFVFRFMATKGIKAQIGRLTYEMSKLLKVCLATSS